MSASVTRCLVVLLTVGALAAAPAQAAPPWSDPVVAPGSRSDPALVFSPDGRALITELGPGGYGRRYPGTSGATLDPGGAVGPFRVLARNFDAGSYTGRIAIDRAGRVSAFGEGGTRSGIRLMGAEGSTGGPLARRRDIGLGEPTAGIAADANARGDHAVLFQVSGSSRSLRRRSIYLVVRRAGRGFSRPVRIARGPDVAALDVAVGDGGDVAAAWARDAVAVRRYSATGRLGRVQPAADDPNAQTIRAAVAPAGQVLVSWSAEAPGPPDAGFVRRNPFAEDGPFAIRAALAPPGGGFGPVRTLGASDGATVLAEPLGDDRFTLAHEGLEDERPVVRVADGGTEGEVVQQTVSTPGAIAWLSDLATGPRGETAVIWRAEGVEGPETGRGEVMAAVRAPGSSSFSLPESVTQGPESGTSDLAINPVDGRVVVAVGGGPTPTQVFTRPPITP